MPSRDIIQDFVVAVANGYDRTEPFEKPNYFVSRFGGWFPMNRGTSSFNAEEYLRELRPWIKDVPKESPHPQLGLHVAVLRQKFRVIWAVANAGEWESAERKVGYLRTDFQRYQANWQTGTNQLWRKKWFDVCRWMMKNAHRLLICKNPGCASPYFVRDEKNKNQQYCCQSCADEGQSLRWSDRAAASKNKISPEGRKAISDAQKKRWQDFRAARKQVKKMVSLPKDAAPEGTE